MAIVYNLLYISVKLSLLFVGGNERVVYFFLVTTIHYYLKGREEMDGAEVQ